MTPAHGVWLALAAGLAAAGLLLAVGQNRSARFANLGLPALFAALLRAGLWLADPRYDPWDVAGAAVLVAMLLAALVGARAWLVRTSREALFAELAGCCASVRIVCRREPAPADELTLLLKEGPQAIRVLTLTAGLQLLRLPKTSSKKANLLVVLLGKRYPPPWPRFTVKLSSSRE